MTATSTNFTFNVSDFINNNSDIDWIQVTVVEAGSIIGNYSIWNNYSSPYSNTVKVTWPATQARLYITAGNGTATNFGSESQITSSALNNYRYGVYEFNLDGNYTDVADITAENGIGFNISAESVQTSGNNFYTGFSVPYQNIVNSIKNINANAINSNSSTDLNMIYGPSGSPGSGYWPASYWTNYTNLVGGWGVSNKPSTINDIGLGGIYGVPGGGYQIYNYKAYSTTYNSQNGIMFYPSFGNTSNATLPNNVSFYKDWIFVPQTTLLNNIYQPGSDPTTYPVYLFNGGPSATPTTIGFSTTPPYSAAAIALTALATGFEAGFYGSYGRNPNPLVYSYTDLNKNWNYSWNYAYAGGLNTSSPSYGTSNGSINTLSIFNNGSAPANNTGYYDPYSVLVSSVANQYSWPYSDFLSTWGGLPPTLTLWDYGQNQNVQQVNINLYGDTTTQPSTNFLAPSVGYLPNILSANVAPTVATNALFNMVYAGFTPDPNMPALLRIYAPGEKGVDPQGFINFELNSQKDANTWQNYTITTGSKNTPYTITRSGAAATGTIGLFNLPVAANGGTAWYQLIIGDLSHSTTYNIYSIADANGNYKQVISDQSLVVTANVTQPVGNPPISMSPDNNVNTYSQILLNPAANYVTFDPGVWSAPSYNRFNDAPLSNNIIVADRNGGQVANWVVSQDGSVSQITLNAAVGPGWVVAGTGNFSGTSDTNILWERGVPLGQTQLAIWDVSGADVSSPSIISQQLNSNQSVVAIGDFLGVGYDNQILTQTWNSKNDRYQLNYMMVNGQGDVTKSGAFGKELKNGESVVGVGNFFNNNQTDVLIQNGSSLSILSYDDWRVTKTALSENSSFGWQVIGIGDVNNDGNSDIFFQRNNEIGLWEMQGANVLHATNLGTLQAGQGFAGIGDYNQDGTSDLLLQNGASFQAWLMDGSVVSGHLNLNQALNDGWSLQGTGNLNSPPG